MFLMSQMNLSSFTDSDIFMYVPESFVQVKVNILYVPHFAGIYRIQTTRLKENSSDNSINATEQTAIKTKDLKH